MVATDKRPEEWGKEHGFCKSAVYRAIKQQFKTGKTTTRVRSLIAKTINLPQSDIWPDRTKGNT